MYPMLMLDLTPEVLADYLIRFSVDWMSDLEFIENVALDRGLPFDANQVATIVEKVYDVEKENKDGQ